MDERDEEGKESSRERSEGTSGNKEMKGGGGEGRGKGESEEDMER